MTDGFTDTIEKLKTEIETNISKLKRDPAWVQLEKLYRALTVIEGVAEQPRTSLADLFGIGDAGAVSRSARVGQGEFYGLEALDAAKRYLKRKGEAATLEEIMTAVIDTGRANTVDRDQLRISLSRSTSVIARVDEDLYGLREFFPHTRRRRKRAAVGQGETEDGPEAKESDAGESAINAGGKVPTERQKCPTLPS